MHWLMMKMHSATCRQSKKCCVRTRYLHLCGFIILYVSHVVWRCVKGMDLVESLNHVGFNGYLKQYHNTICGRHPIGVLLAVSLFHCRLYWHEWVSVWVSEWVSVWVSEWVCVWVSECVSVWVSECVSEWVCEWVSVWVSEWVSEWVSGV